MGDVEELITTTKGLMARRSLRIVTDTAKVPCGERTETRYYLGDELVRQDVNIDVTDPPTMMSEGGL